METNLQAVMYFVEYPNDYMFSLVSYNVIQIVNWHFFTVLETVRATNFYFETIMDSTEYM